MKSSEINAWETRKESILSQHEEVMKTIKDAKSTGWKWTYVAKGKGSLYPEVAKMMSEKGYDILIRKNPENDFHSTNLVSWENAEEGRKGTVTVKEEISLKNTVKEVKTDLENAGKEIKQWAEPGLQKGREAIGTFVQSAKRRMEDCNKEDGKKEN